MVKQNDTRASGTSQDPYGKVHASAIEAVSGELAAVAVYAALATWADVYGDCWPHRSTIAERLGVSVATVGRAINVLRAAGVITTRARMSGHAKVGTVYTLVAIVGASTGKRADAPTLRARDPLPKTREQTTMNKDTPPTPSPVPLASVTDLHPGKLLDVPTTVDIVFREWQSAIESWRRSTGRRPSRFVLSDKRRTLIRARLAEGFDVDDLKDAARGWRRSAFHCGANDRRKPFNSLELVFRDADHVEQFRDMERDFAATVPLPQAAPIPDPAIDAVQRMRNLEGRV